MFVDLQRRMGENGPASGLPVWIPATGLSCYRNRSHPRLRAKWWPGLNGATDFLGNDLEGTSVYIVNKAASLRAATLSPTNQPRTETLSIPTFLKVFRPYLQVVAAVSVRILSPKPTPHGGQLC